MCPIIETVTAVANAVKIISEAGAVANGIYRVGEALNEGDLIAAVSTAATAAVGGKIPANGTIGKLVKASSEVGSAANCVFRVNAALNEGDLLKVVGDIATPIARATLPDASGERGYRMKLPDASGEPKYTMKLPDAMSLKLATIDKKDVSDQVEFHKKPAHEMQNETSKNYIPLSLKEQTEIDRTDVITQKIGSMLSTPEGIKSLIEAHPEKADYFKSVLNAVDTLNDPQATPLEKERASQRIDSLKGTIFELATKDALSETGLSVEEKQRTVDGETGGTRPDVIAKNDTDEPISVFGIIVNPGEVISVECKCGQKTYLETQLRNHIPNQLSGHEGHSVLLTTSDIKDVTPGLAENICTKYDTTLSTIEVSACDVKAAIKGVSL